MSNAKPSRPGKSQEAPSKPAADTNEVVKIVDGKEMVFTVVTN